MFQTTDVEIRAALHSKRLKADHESSESFVIDELGVEHGSKRIDIAVFNGCLHGYEIKSSQDTLERLPEQVSKFSKCMEKLTIVTAANHLENIEKIIPEWCGLVLVEKGKRGGIKFKTIRKPTLNPEVEFRVVAHFLWRGEALSELKKLGAPSFSMKGPRIKLYEELRSYLTLSELYTIVKKCFMGRENWRVPQQQRSCGD